MVVIVTPVRSAGAEVFFRHSGFLVHFRLLKMIYHAGKNEKFGLCCALSPPSAAQGELYSDSLRLGSPSFARYSSPISTDDGR